MADDAELEMQGIFDLDRLFRCQSILEAIRPFSNELLKYQASKRPGQNVLVSPWSAFQLLTLVRLGATGRTADEIGKLQHTPFDAVAIAEETDVALRAMEKLESKEIVKQSNSIWVGRGLQLQETYKRLATDLLRSEVRSTKFPEPGRAEIETFVQQKTTGRIKAPTEVINEETLLVALQTILMLDSWAKPFPLEDTSDLPFKNSTGVTSEIPTMHMSGKFDYGETPTCQVLDLHYASGLVMNITLPRPGHSVLEVLEVGSMTATQEYRGEVYMPRWEFELEWDMALWMRDSGCTAPFLDILGGFTLMASEPLVLQAAIQKVKIRVDEVGTEAAAISIMSLIAMGGIRPRIQEPFEFRADRPFLFSILAPGGIPLFAGIVNDPSSM